MSFQFAPIGVKYIKAAPAAPGGAILRCGRGDAGGGLAGFKLNRSLTRI